MLCWKSYFARLWEHLWLWISEWLEGIRHFFFVWDIRQHQFYKVPVSQFNHCGFCHSVVRVLLLFTNYGAALEFYHTIERVHSQCILLAGFPFKTKPPNCAASRWPHRWPLTMQWPPRTEAGMWLPYCSAFQHFLYPGPVCSEHDRFPSHGVTVTLGGIVPGTQSGGSPLWL